MGHLNNGLLLKFFAVATIELMIWATLATAVLITVINVDFVG